MPAQHPPVCPAGRRQSRCLLHIIQRRCHIARSTHQARHKALLLGSGRRRAGPHRRQLRLELVPQVDVGGILGARRRTLAAPTCLHRHSRRRKHLGHSPDAHALAGRLCHLLANLATVPARVVVERWWPTEQPTSNSCQNASASDCRQPIATSTSTCSTHLAKCARASRSLCSRSSAATAAWASLL